jgi:L-alanine-DL-glutamate epimerase-like enolase superfamily enzyme
MLACYEDHGVEAVEQPLPYWDLDGMAYVRARSPIPIMADESCFTPQDASAIVRARAADIINIKLMKCGGLNRALRINAVAEAAGVACMLGCMLESRLAIAAGAHLVASHSNFVYADLDSFADFDDTSVVVQAFDYQAPQIRLPDTPGIGVSLSF